jgi:hypothetical protein
MTTTAVAMTTIRGDAPKVRDCSGVPLAKYYLLDFITGCE